MCHSAGVTESDQTGEHPSLWRSALPIELADQITAARVSCERQTISL